MALSDLSHLSALAISAPPGPPLGVLPDTEIARLATEFGMIEPFNPELVGYGVHSTAGLGGHTYDLALGNRFATLKPNVDAKGKRLPPRRRTLGPVPEDWLTWTDIEPDGEFILPPLTFCLAGAAAKIRMPRDVIGLVLDKSTGARSALGAFNTFIDAGFVGGLTLEFFNYDQDSELVLTPGTGIVQVLFIRVPTPRIAYDQRLDGRGGKYQFQDAVTAPRL